MLEFAALNTNHPLMIRLALKIIFLLAISCGSFAQPQQKNTNKAQSITVIAYYFGPAEQVDSFAAEKLTHIIFSFCHLKGNKLVVDKARDSLIIQKLVSLKSRNPQLKVLLSLGGWGGCETCSQVFSNEKGRTEFAQSVKDLTDYFHTDGID